MRDEYRTFLGLLTAVVRCGCDGVATESNPASFAWPLLLPENETRARLYEPRGVEQTIVDWLSGRFSLLCLIGEQGSGLSSIAHGVLSDIRAKRADVFTVILDLRSEMTNPEFGGAFSVTIEQLLRRRLRAAYLASLFPLTEKGLNPRVKLWTYLLDRANDSGKPAHLFSAFGTLQDAAARHLRRHDLGHPVSTDLATWLEKNWVNEKQLTEDLEALVDFSHLVYAARFALGRRQQIIWFDNVAALPDDLRVETVHAARRILLPVRQHVSMLIPLREESIVRDYDFHDEGVPAWETRVLLEVPETGEDYRYYPALDVPVADDAVLTSIVSRRLAVTRDYQRRRAGEIMAQLEATATTADESRRLSVELNALTPILSVEGFVLMERVTARLMVALRSEHAIYLTNSSLSAFLELFADCLTDVFKESDAVAVDDAEQFPDWLVAAHVLRRAIHRLPHQGAGSSSDVLAQPLFTDDVDRVGCVLPYLIITTIWNLTINSQTIENRHGRSPALADVERHLTHLGYLVEEVRNALQYLYFSSRSRINLIGVRSSATVRSAADLRADHKLYVTLRGKCFVASTGSSFSHLYDCIADVTTYVPGREVPATHAAETAAVAVRRILPDLCDIADTHRRAMQSIRDGGGLGDTDWLTRFYLLHGTPQVFPFARGAVGGREVRGVRRMLFLENMLSGLITEADLSPWREEFVKILNDYMDRMNDLSAVE